MDSILDGNFEDCANSGNGSSSRVVTKESSSSTTAVVAPRKERNTLSNRDQRIQDLKNRMVSMYGTSLLNVAVSTETLRPLRKDDTPEERARKQSQNKQIIEAREAAYQAKLPEMIKELEKLMTRIHETNRQQLRDDVDDVVQEQQQQVGTSVPSASTTEAAAAAATAITTTTGAHSNVVVNTIRERIGGMENVYSTGLAAMAAFNMRCTVCGNRNQNHVFRDSRRGDVTCLGRDGKGCGAVMQEHAVAQGAERRNHEGEEDKRTFGPAPNKLLGDAANMATAMNTKKPGTSDRENSAWKHLQQAQQDVEMSLSSLGKDDRHTRQGYKEQQKLKAFARMEEIAVNLNIHQLAVQRAKEEFAMFRELRSAIQQYEGIVCACLVLAYEELSKELSLDQTVTYSVLDNNGTSTSFGHVRPRTEVTQDMAICTVPQSSLGKFTTMAQVKEWLLAAVQSPPHGSSHDTSTKPQQQQQAPNVESTTGTTGDGGGSGAAGGVDGKEVTVATSTAEEVSAPEYNYEAEAMMVFEFIKRQHEDQTRQISLPSGKPNVPNESLRNSNAMPKTTIFGSVTVSGRRKRYEEQKNKALKQGNALKVPGKLLLRVDFSQALAFDPTSVDALTQSRRTEAVKRLRSALVRRSQYDAALFEYERVSGLQATRLRIEELATSTLHESALRSGINNSGSGINSSNQDVLSAGKLSTSEEKETDGPALKRSRLVEQGNRGNQNNMGVTKVASAGPADAAAAVSSQLPMEQVVEEEVQQETTEQPQEPIQEENEDMDEFDLEDLVGGPVASAASSRYDRLSVEETRAPVVVARKPIILRTAAAAVAVASDSATVGGSNNSSGSGRVSESTASDKAGVRNTARNIVPPVTAASASASASSNGGGGGGGDGVADDEKAVAGASDPSTLAVHHDSATSTSTAATASKRDSKAKRARPKIAVVG